jgi:hypothetical protein
MAVLALRYGVGMEEFSGVLWGALIALVASVLGGLLTAVVGPWLARRSELRTRAAQKAAEAAAERETVLKDAIKRISEGLRLWAEAWGRSNTPEKEEHRREVREANLTLRLWTTDAERAVGMCVVNVLEAKHPYDAVNRYSAWDDAALQWFRGTLSADQFGQAYQRLVAAQAEEAEARQTRDIAERQAARNEGTFPWMQ